MRDFGKRNFGLVDYKNGIIPIMFSIYPEKSGQVVVFGITRQFAYND
jgi:hypothetical protein